MAGLKVKLSSGEVTTGTLANRTVLQYAAEANAGAKVNGLDITFTGTSATAGRILTQVVKGQTAGSGTGTTQNPTKISGHAGSVRGAGKKNFTAEPSGGTVIWSQQLPPNYGGIIPLREPVQLDPGETLSIVVYNPGTAVNCNSNMDIEE